MTHEATITLGVAALLFRGVVKDASKLAVRILKRRARRLRAEARGLRARGVEPNWYPPVPPPRQAAPPPDSTDAFYVPPGRGE